MSKPSNSGYFEPEQLRVFLAQVKEVVNGDVRLPQELSVGQRHAVSEYLKFP